MYIYIYIYIYIYFFYVYTYFFLWLTRFVFHPFRPSTIPIGPPQLSRSAPRSLQSRVQPASSEERSSNESRVVGLATGLRVKVRVNPINPINP